MLGGKTYFFANYQGFRWPNSGSVERAVPSEAMRNGFLTFNGVQYNLLNYDPLGIGINPLVQQLWNKYLPKSNESSCGLTRCDNVNVQGFLANVSLPQNDNFGVARLDHDFGDKWHFTSSYRYYHLTRATTNQVDIGGFFPGDTLGTPASVSNRPQVPWFLVAGLTTNISSNTTNDFHYSYLRNYWAMARPVIRRSYPVWQRRWNRLARRSWQRILTLPLQCEHAEYAYPLLGWARQHVSRMT